MIKLQSLSHSSIVSDVRDLSPQCSLKIRGQDPASPPVQAGSLWLYSAFLRSLLASQLGTQEEKLIVMPGFDREDIEASVRMLEVADTESNLVFNGRSKEVLETLGVCLQHHKSLEALEARGVTISVEKKTSKIEDDLKLRIKEEPQQDERRDLEEIQKLLLDNYNSSFETSEEEDNNVEELKIKNVKGNFEEELDFYGFSDEEEGGQNANKSFELSDDEAATMERNLVSTKSLPKQIDQEDKMEEVRALVKKSEDVWSCKSCGYFNKRKAVVIWHAERHVKGLMFPCGYCHQVYPTRRIREGHTYSKHRAERKQRASILVNTEDAELVKAIDEKVKNFMEKEEGKLWKCKQCDRVSNRAAIRNHCETHLTGYSFLCQICGHKTTNRVAMKHHRRIKHSGKRSYSN